MTFKIDRGLLWPGTDVGGAQVMISSAATLESVYAHCNGFDVAVQAGGHCGVWPAAMAQKFKAVYTFEPDPLNFHCLCKNAPAQNIFKFNAALGDDRIMTDMKRRPENTGAHQTNGTGPIPTLRIDDLGLEICNLIYLDIEGDEMAALMGARATIRVCRPVVVFEDKGLKAKQGVIEKWLESYGYRVAERCHRDVVMAP